MHSKKLFFSTAVLCVSVSLLLVGCVCASSGMWSRTYGGASDDSAEAVVQTSDGGYALAGYTQSFGAGSYDFWLIKTNKYGEIEWNQTYGRTGLDRAYALVETSDGGYALAGDTSFGASLVKTDVYGNMEWNKTYSGLQAYALIETADGGFALAGYTRTIGMGDMPHWDFWLMKTDVDGNMEWERAFGRINGSTTGERAYALVETSDGGYALAGYTSVFSPETGITGGALLVKTDSFGNVEWNQTYSGWRAFALVQASDGGYVLSGTGPLVKTDMYGNVEWNQTVGGLVNSLVATSDGGYALAGNGPLVKTDEYGNMLWNQTVGGLVNSLVATSDGGYALAGALNGDFWLAKADEQGVIPEFPSWSPVLVGVVALVSMMTVYRKKLKKLRG
jgi:hypothetical protein